MSAYRNSPAPARPAGTSHLGRKVLCAFVACALTVVLLGEVGKSAAQAAERATAEQSDNDRTVGTGLGIDAPPVKHSAPRI